MPRSTWVLYADDGPTLLGSLHNCAFSSSWLEGHWLCKCIASKSGISKYTMQSRLSSIELYRYSFKQCFPCLFMCSLAHIHFCLQRSFHRLKEGWRGCCRRCEAFLGEACLLSLGVFSSRYSHNNISITHKNSKFSITVFEMQNVLPLNL